MKKSRNFKFRHIVFCLMVLITTTALTAQTNTMDIMTYMAGEFAGSEFGESMASLDFNGDGYMDLVVSSGAWNPDLIFADQNRWGKLYFYWGGPNFDNIVDFVILGTYNWHIGLYAEVTNAGDVNGDGIDDIVVFQRSASYDSNIALFLGNANPSNSPVIVLSYAYNPYPGIHSIGIIPLGDINGDHHHDLCLVLYRADGLRELLVWTDYNAQPWLFMNTLNSQTLPILSGIGDVNSDGFDDVLLHMPNNSTGESHNRLVLYYGNQTFPQTDSLVICEDSNRRIKKWACPVGDVNGDGFADFTAGNLLYDYRQNLWLGGTNIAPQWDVVLEATFLDDQLDISERGTGFPFVHGDVNGDGYQDVFGFHSEAGYYNGTMYMWMGGPNMNGSLDGGQMSAGGYDHQNFGWSKATGDFNADGYCDVAVGAPWGAYNDHQSTGRVYIIAGNADLHETTVNIEDSIIPPVANHQWQLEIYPNPVADKHDILSVIFKGDGYKRVNNLSLEVYNLKGQRLAQRTIDASALQEGKLELTLGKYPAGIYIVSIKAKGNTKYSKRFCIM